MAAKIHDGATLKFFKDAEGKWRWNLTAMNGNIIATSGEGYERISGAANGFNAVATALGSTMVVTREQVES